MLDCRLSLAYGQILTGAYAEALKNIQASEKVYADRRDPLNQARCWMMQASCLRRQDQLEYAFATLERSLAVFERRGSIVDQAKAHYQIGLGHLLRIEDLSDAVDRFSKAKALFEPADLDLWRAMCINDLGSVYLYTGELALADKHYQEAGEVFKRHEISGLLADNLNDHGEVNVLRGRPDISIEQFQRSIAINEELGSLLPAAIAYTNLGKAYGQSGRYQEALTYLEEAAERLESLHSYLRLATCEKYAALLWSQLGRPDLAHEYLDRATFHYELVEQKTMLAEAYNIRATTLIQQGGHQEAIQYLEKSLALSLKYGMHTQAALARRLLGEAFTQTGQYQPALNHLQEAQKNFSEMGMMLSLASNWVAMGNYYAQIPETEAAGNAFRQALQLNEEILPEIEWNAQVGLADLAASRADHLQALETYQRAIKAFARIQQDFWQPALAGSYLEQPAQIFERMIALASKTDAAQEALLFIEQAKSSTLLRQLRQGNLPRQASDFQALNDLEAEILFLEDQLRTSPGSSVLFPFDTYHRQIQQKRSEKTGQYDELKTSLERKASLAGMSGSGVL